MAILNFPDTTGQPIDGSFTYEDNGVLYSWDGYKWTANSEQAYDDKYVEVAGDNMTGDLTLGTDKIVLNASDGIASFAGRVYSTRVANTSCFQAYTTGDPQAKVDLNSNGNATFAGDVTALSLTATTDVNAVNVIASGDIQSTSQNGGPLAGFRNQIINPTLSVFQRSANAGGTGYRSADRWRLGGTAPNLQIVYPSIAGLPAGSAGRLTASAGGGTIAQSVELPVSGRAAPFLTGTKWTLSFYTTHPSLVANDVSVRFADDSNTTGNQTEFTQGALTTIESLTSGWVRYAVTYTAPSGVAGSNKCVNVRLSGLADGSAVDFTGIQFEPGPVATPLEHRPIGTELALCQRYFYALNGEIQGVQQSAASGLYLVTFPVEMRTTPSASLTTVADWTVSKYAPNASAINAVATNFAIQGRQTNQTFTIRFGNSGSSGNGNGTACQARKTAADGSGAPVYFNAEL